MAATAGGGNGPPPPMQLGTTAGMDRTTAELLRQIGIATSPRRRAPSAPHTPFAATSRPASTPGVGMSGATASMHGLGASGIPAFGASRAAFDGSPPAGMAGLGASRTAGTAAGLGASRAAGTAGLGVSQATGTAAGFGMPQATGTAAGFGVSRPAVGSARGGDAHSAMLAGRWTRDAGDETMGQEAVPGGAQKQAQSQEPVAEAASSSATVVVLDGVGMDDDDREFASLLSRIVKGHARETAEVDAEFSALHDSVAARTAAVADREASFALGGGPQPAAAEYSMDGRKKQSYGGRTTYTRLIDDTVADFVDAQRGAQTVLGRSGGGGGVGVVAGVSDSSFAMQPGDLEDTSRVGAGVAHSGARAGARAGGSGMDAGLGVAGDGTTPGGVAPIVVGLPMTPGRHTGLHDVSIGKVGGHTGATPGGGKASTAGRTPGRSRVGRAGGSMRRSATNRGRSGGPTSTALVSQQDVRSAESALEESMARIQRGEAPLYVPEALSTARKVERARQREQQRRMVATFKERFQELAQRIRTQHADEHKRIITKSLREVSELVARHMQRKVTRLDHTSKDNGQQALIHLTHKCLLDMETWVRDLKSRVDNEATRATAQLRQQFEQEATETLTLLAESSQQLKEDGVRHLLMDIKSTKEKHVEELKAALLTERDTKLAHLRQRLEAKLQHELKELEQIVTVEGGRRLEVEMKELRASYEKKRQTAQRSLVEANRAAAVAVRSQLEAEHKKAMEAMAKRTLQASEDELNRRRAMVRREAEVKEAEAIAQVKRALVDGHVEAIAELKRQYEEKTRVEIARVRKEFKAKEAPQLASLEAKLRAKFETELASVRSEAEGAVEDAKQELRRVMEEQKMSRVVEVTSRLRKEKEKAEAAARATADEEAEARIQALVEALENDKRKAVRNLMEVKKLELVQRLGQLETKLVGENNAMLAEEVAKWDAVREETEAHLRATLTVASVASDSDEEGGEGAGGGGGTPLPQGLQGKALFWMRSMSSQFRDMYKRFQNTNAQLGRAARETLVLKRQLGERTKEVQRLQRLLDEAERNADRAAAGNDTLGNPGRRTRTLQAANQNLLAKVSMLQAQLRQLQAGSTAGGGTPAAAADEGRASAVGTPRSDRSNRSSRWGADAGSNHWAGRFEGVSMDSSA